MIYIMNLNFSYLRFDFKSKLDQPHILKHNLLVMQKFIKQTICEYVLVALAFSIEVDSVG